MQDIHNHTHVQYMYVSHIYITAKYMYMYNVACQILVTLQVAAAWYTVLLCTFYCGDTSKNVQQFYTAVFEKTGILMYIHPCTCTDM